MHSLAIAHKKLVLERIAAFCADAGCRETAEVVQWHGLFIGGACAVMVSGARALKVFSEPCPSIGRSQSRTRADGLP